MKILGISAFYHDSAAALVIDGKIVAAAQEERFTRKKHDASYPTHAVDYVLKEARLRLRDIDYIAFYDKPFLKFERLIETYLAFAPRGFASFSKAMPVWIKEKLFQKSGLIKKFKEKEPEFDWEKRLLFSEHHLSHAASAFYPSPFSEALVLTMDGVGEWTTTSASLGKGNSLQIFKEIHFPHSLGLLYSAFTYYTGFKVNSGEYKVMGLAPYGVPRYKDKILENLIDLKGDGSFRLNMKYFDYCTGLKMTNHHFDALFGGPARKPESPLTQREMDLAASVQAVTEEVVITLARALAKETGQRNLCMAGGVALNCVANGKLLREDCFQNIWLQPAAGDAGGALGAALAIYYAFLKQDRRVEDQHDAMDAMQGSYLGVSFSDDEIVERLTRAGAKLHRMNDDQTFVENVAGALADEKAVGWFQGRMEFGPRALGARSIIADARSPRMQKNLNLKVKFRESFRPFAPAVLFEDVADWFAIEEASPYMLMVADVHKQHQIKETAAQSQLFGLERLNLPRSAIPAVTHVDYSARIQTVHKETNAKFHNLISEFKRRTECPVVVNTSFNIRGEPIVCTPEDAFKCFMGTDLDVLAIGNCYLEKSEQDTSLAQDYKNKFELD